MQKYTVAVCLLVKDENEYLEEWLDWHVRAGVEHFYIYDNGSKLSVADSIGPEYRDRCTVVDFGGAHVHTQIEAYTDCLDRFGSEAEWVAFIDTDEFIRVVDRSDLREFMRSFEDADALAVKWTVYNADGQMRKTAGPVRERFRQVVEYPLGYPHCKCIVRPAGVSKMAAHNPIQTDRSLTVVSEYNTPVMVPIDQRITNDTITIDHYFTRSYEEWCEKLARGSCDPTCRRGPEWFDMLNPGLREETESEQVQAGAVSAGQIPL